jgi:ABC-type bacteriocin/lantibiotic exporter with double-glycine peptidase domain
LFKPYRTRYFLAIFIGCPLDLDKESEQQVNQAISQYNITRVIIAHRRETIEMADRIIDLRDLCNVKNIEDVFNNSQNKNSGNLNITHQ